MNEKLVYLQLLAMKHLCLAVVTAIDAVLASMTAKGEESATETEPEEVGGPCRHPLARRIPIPAMGPRRYKCMDCNEDVLEEGEVA